MKDHVWEVRWINTPYQTPLGDFLAHMEGLSQGLVDPVVNGEYMWEDSEWQVCGWRPMTEKELERAKKRRAAARLANRAKKEKKAAEERETLRKLKEKYPDV